MMRPLCSMNLISQPHSGPGLSPQQCTSTIEPLHPPTLVLSLTPSSLARNQTFLCLECLGHLLMCISRKTEGQDFHHIWRKRFLWGIPMHTKGGSSSIQSQSDLYCLTGQTSMRNHSLASGLAFPPLLHSLHSLSHLQLPSPPHPPLMCLLMKMMKIRLVLKCLIRWERWECLSQLLQQQQYHHLPLLHHLPLPLPFPLN